MSIERINLRLNLEDPMDLAIWNLVKDKKNKKGTYIKYLLYNMTIGENKLMQESSITSIESNTEKNRDIIENTIDESEIPDEVNEAFN